MLMTMMNSTMVSDPDGVEFTANKTKIDNLKPSQMARPPSQFTHRQVN